MNTHSMVNLPANVDVIGELDELKLLHYSMEATHPGPTDFYKGVVVEGPQVVARSFQWAPTVIDYELPEGMLFTRYHEATVLRFYRHGGEPMVSTHRQINIVGRNSRAGTGRPFIELVEQAIRAWPYSEESYFIPPIENAPSRKGLAFTPTRWEDLCVSGVCSVFLLMDQSNQITDIDSLSDTYELATEDGKETVSFSGPKLLHIMTLYQDDDVMTPTLNPIVLDVSPDDEGYTQYTLNVPRVEMLSRDDALSLLTNGSAVVGFRSETPDMTIKYFSPKYARKVELAGETFNPIFRWHQLMDIDPDAASEYLSNLPFHQKQHSIKSMQDMYFHYLEESSNYLADNIIQRVKGNVAPLNHQLYENVKDFYPSVLQKVRKFANQEHPPTDRELDNYATSLVASELRALPFTKQHNIHGRIAKIKAGRI